MAKRVFSRIRSPRKRSSEFSSVSDGGMNVEIPEFAVQSKTTAASPPPPPSGNLKTQLSRATRFGHNLTQMPAQEEQGGRGAEEQGREFKGFSEMF